MKALNAFIIFLMTLLVCQPLWADEKLTWDDCLRLASQQHPDLVSAKEEVRQSQDTKTITASTLWPQANTNVGISQAKSENTKSTVYSYGVSGSQLLFDGFKTINNVNASKENIKVSQWNFQFVSSQVRFRLRTAFINLLKAQELIKLTKEIHGIRKQNLDLITLRYNSGTEHKGALLTAQANLAQAEFEIHQADRNLQVAQRDLIKEIGGKDVGTVEVDGTFEITGKYDQKPDMESLADNNPQFLKLNAQTNSAAFDVKSSQGSFWPSISLLGDTSKSDSSWPPKALSTTVGVALTWPFLEGGSRIAQLDKSRSIVKDLDAQQQSLKDSLELALEQAWASLQDAIEQVGVQKIFLDAADERAKIAQQQYSVGLLAYDNWTIIEDTLVSNKKTFLNTQADLLLAETNWVEAQGRTLEYAN